MRYVVIGAGAVGGTIGGRLHEAGRDVVLVARGPHLAALRADGLRLDEPDRSQLVRVPVTGSPTEVDWRSGDVAVLATKTQDTAAILDRLVDVAPAVPVVCAQNGVANERLAAARFAHVVAMCVILPAEHLQPGRVAAHSAPVPGILDVGRYPLGVDDLAAGVAADLTAAGFSARADPAIMRAKYRKLLGNLGNAAEAACGIDDPDLPALFAAARAEGEACLTAAGIDVASAEEEQARRGDLITVHPVGGGARGGGSTWQSVRRGRPTEVEHLNGEIVALGRRHGVPTPVNALLVEVTSGLTAVATRRAADPLAQAGPRRSAR